MKKFRGMYMTEKEYMDWMIKNLEYEVRWFMQARSADMREFYSDRIHQHEMELVSLGYSWEKVEELEIKFMKECA